jgi:hypothetical protein
MSYVPTLIASLNARLDELAAEISTLEQTRAALRTSGLAPQRAAVDHDGAADERSRRPTAPAKPPAPRRRQSAEDSQPGVADARANGSSATASKPRRRAAATATPKSRGAARTAPKRRSIASLTADQLERLLAGATSGLSATAIAARANVGYSRVLALLRALEASGKVRRTGSRRSTLWLLITDEDRIAQRTAELERLMGARRNDPSQRRGRARAS